MTWNQQIRGLKRQLSSKQLQERWRRKRRQREQRLSSMPCSPVTVRGVVTPEFRERMRTMGVSVLEV